MKFTKMHGAGNDYVFVDCFNESVDDPSALAPVVSDRHRGIGADGLILIRPSSRSVAAMEMYNADGSRGRMCGNGLRCVAKYLYEHGLTQERRFAIETDDGVRQAECTVEKGCVVSVRVDMGTPRFAPADIPADISGDSVIDRPLMVNGRPLVVTCLSMGNPHAIVFLDAADGVDFPTDGPALERHPLFPMRINAHFVRVTAADHVTVRTWERGTGPTRACGSGAAAVAVAGARTGRTSRHVVVESAGGALDVLWGDDQRVHLTGPAVEVYTGTWPC